MKLTTILMLTIFLQVSAGGYSQTMITLSAKNVTLETVFREIEKKSDYRFFYKMALLPAEANFSIDVKNTAIEEVVALSLKGLPLTYTIVDKFIVIVPKITNALPSIPLIEPLADISGVVKNAVTGETLSGVSVQVKGGARGTVTDEKGRFTLTGIDANATLTISSVGYLQKEVKLEGKTTIEVKLELSNNALDETVITGYQAFTKRRAPGVIATVRPEDLTQKGAISLDQMLEGKVAGMSVTGNIGNPGAPPKIRIRGTSSISGDQEPIWVIDGVIWEESVPVRNRDLATLDEESMLAMIGGSVAGLNPKDIESINVLKDASATAIYGVRAANGVVVVTTKRGQAGRARVNYSTDLKTNRRPSYDNFALMNSLERIQLSQDIVSTGLLYPMRPGNIGYEGALMDLRNKNINQETFDSLTRYYAGMNTDWFDLLFRNSFSQNHNISVSGGADKTTYFFSGSMYDEQANARESNLKRYTVSSRLNTQLRDNLTLDVKVGGNLRENNAYHSSINPFNYATQASRALPAYHPDGSLAYYDRRNSVELKQPGDA